MSHLQNKSETNFKAAKLLIKEELYASSVHCSYYGMFQFLICKYAKVLDKPFDEIAQESKGEGSHKYIINGLTRHIKSTFKNLGTVQKNVKETNFQRNVTRKIKDLKNYRVKSDYRNIEVSEEMSKKCNNLSTKIVEEIKEYPL